MKIATAPVNWNNPDVPEYRAWIPYEQMLDEFVGAGYDACEWGSNMPTEPAVLNAELKTRGLTMVGAFVGLSLRDPAQRQAEIDRALATAAFLKAAGGTRLIAADSGDSRRRSEAGHVNGALGLRDDEWQSLGSGLNEIGEALQPLGMRVVFHNHVGTYVETPEETARLLDSTDARLVGWCLDCGHLAYGGGDSLKMLDRYGDRVEHVHIKDVDGEILARARAGNWSFATALKTFIFAPLGEGIVQIPRLVDALASHGYDGWLVIEQDTTPADPTATARQNREYLERLLT